MNIFNQDLKILKVHEYQMRNIQRAIENQEDYDYCEEEIQDEPSDEED